MNRRLIPLFFFLVLTPVLPVSSSGKTYPAEISVYPVIHHSISRTWDDLSLIYQEQFHNSSEIVEEIEKIESSVPQLVDISTIGQSVQGKDIHLVRITNEANTNPKAGVFFVAQHHAREQITVEAALRFILYLVNNYGDDPDITAFIDTEEIFIIPTLNPDGNDIVVDGGNEYLRKNLRQFNDDSDTYGNGTERYDEDDISDEDGDGKIYSIEIYAKNGTNWDLMTSSYDDNLVKVIVEGKDEDGDGLINEDPVGGVDLNRNYGYRWNDSSVDSGWGSDTTSEDFPGTAAFSEPETVAIRDFVLEHKFAAAMSLHCGTNDTYFPWGSTGMFAELDLYRQIWTYLREIIPSYFFYADNARQPSKNIATYTVAGGWEDWMYATAGCVVPLTFEIYHNTSSIQKDVNYFLDPNEYPWKSNATHQVWKWTGMYEYFAPYEGPAIDNLWQDIQPAFDYWLEITPRLSIKVNSITKQGVNEGDRVTISFNIKNPSPVLSTIAPLTVTDSNYNPLTTDSVARIDPMKTSRGSISFDLPVSIENSSLIVKVGNDYVGYYDIVIKEGSQQVPGFLINSVLLLIPVLTVLRSRRKTRKK